MDLRRGAGEHLRDDLRGTPKWDARVWGKAVEPADLAAGGVRAHPQRPGAEGCEAIAQRRDDREGVRDSASSARAELIHNSARFGPTMMQGRFRIDALDPAGPNAERISDLFWFMTITSSVIYVIVVTVLLYAALRRREPFRGPAVEARLERRAGVSVAVGVAVTVAVLLVTLVVDFAIARGNAAPFVEQLPITIEIIARQWWWEVRY